MFDSDIMNFLIIFILETYQLALMELLKQKSTSMKVRLYILQQKAWTQTLLITRRLREKKSYFSIW